MNILFRVDCNQEVGFGHMSRCNLIAKYMSSKLNSNIFFLSRNYNCQNFKQNFLTKKIINYKSKKFSFKKDLIKTINVIKKKKIDIVILDNYSCNKRWCNEIKKLTKKLVIIDDGLKSKYKADLYLNYNFYKSNNYRNKLLGYKYFPIDKRYIFVKKKKNILKNDILINLGSGNFKNYIKILINHFENLKLIKKIIIIGKGVNKISNKNIRIKYIKNYSFLGDYIKNSRICIGSGGLNLVERLFLKKKNIVFSTAKHQEKICNYLHKKNFIKYLGSIKSLKNKKHIKRMNYEILKILKNKSNYRNFNLIDGNGIRRISAHIHNL